MVLLVPRGVYIVDPPLHRAALCRPWGGAIEILWDVLRTSGTGLLDIVKWTWSRLGVDGHFFSDIAAVHLHMLL
jgi:hypothetical protein